VDGRWQTNTLDGFGRNTFAQKANGGTNGIGWLTSVTFGGGVKDDLYDAPDAYLAKTSAPANGRLRNLSSNADELRCIAALVPARAS